MIPTDAAFPILAALGDPFGSLAAPADSSGPGTGMTTLGLTEQVFRSPMALILIVVGLLALAMSITMLVRAIPYRAPGVAAPEEVHADDEGAPTGPRQAPAAAARSAPPPPRPRSTTDKVRIHLPDIDDAHPDLWDTQQALRVVVTVKDGDTGRPDATVRLARSVKGHTVPVGETRTDPEGRAMFAVTFPQTAEEDLVATRLIDGRPAGQAVRAVRVVDYRDETVETFEDFKSWAATNFANVDPRHTAREFVDRFADSRPGTPTEPLETIVGIYEIANYSEHPVERTTYLRMVDAFLLLEEAGVLDAEEPVPA